MYYSNWIFHLEKLPSSVFVRAVGDLTPFGQIALQSDNKDTSMKVFLVFSEAYLEPSRTSVMELFAKIVNG